MIYFDHKTTKVLLFIKFKGDKGATWEEIMKKFNKKKEVVGMSLLELFSSELYTVTKDGDGNWIDFSNWSHHASYDFRSFCSPRGNEFLEQRIFNFWKWTIPTFISIIALIISALS